MSHEPTRALVARLRSGDGSAAEDLDRLFREGLVRYCYSFVRDEGEAEDAAQEMLTKVMTSDELPQSFRAWLFRIARNHCLNRLRARGARRSAARLATDAGLAVRMTGNLTRMIEDEQAARVAGLLDALPETQREVLLLRYNEDLTREEIAEVTGESVSVVKSRLYEGLKRLRERVRHEDPPRTA